MNFWALPYVHDFVFSIMWESVVLTIYYIIYKSCCSVLTLVSRKLGKENNKSLERKIQVFYSFSEFHLNKHVQHLHNVCTTSLNTFLKRYMSGEWNLSPPHKNTLALLLNKKKFTITCFVYEDNKGVCVSRYLYHIIMVHPRSYRQGKTNKNSE